jgi:Phosphotriesterase family
LSDTRRQRHPVPVEKVIRRGEAFRISSEKVRREPPRPHRLQRRMTSTSGFERRVFDRDRAFIGHRGDSEDLGYLRGLMERGSTIGMDRFGLEHFLPTAKRVEVLAGLCAEGRRGSARPRSRRCWWRTPRDLRGLHGTLTDRSRASSAGAASFMPPRPDQGPS